MDWSMDARLRLVFVQLGRHLRYRLEDTSVCRAEDTIRTSQSRNADRSQAYLHKHADSVLVDVFHRIFGGHDKVALPFGVIPGSLAT